ncbi:TonB-dependent siderophore receptor [Erythrobacter sp. QSSC1-22B]|uniref:TonB-dependent receptor plug domain-containing protein n=1 Tax=Erythrobacter sp. QSSC1-22B TaxID=1860125 RepID=UPI0009F596F2|nr:TonB-dependent receptor [Erythrobacter sp. QSSC1-22B]
MRKFLFLLTVAAIPTAIPAAVSAQSALPAERVEEAETVVADTDDGVEAITVTATGLFTRIENTGQAVTVIGRDEIEALQGADITRVLARAPGVAFSRNGPLGAFTGVRLRGGEAEQLLVLIDGVRVADPASPSGGFDFGTLTTGTIGKIDLLRGSNSTIWGSDAIAGVIDVSTRGRGGLAGSVEYGARDTFSASATGGLSEDAYFAGLSASYVRSDGFSAAASGTEPDGFEQFTLGGSAFVDLTDRLELFAQGRYAASTIDIDGFPAPAFVFADTAETQETEQLSGALGLAYYGQDLTLRASYALADTSRDNFDPALGDAPLFTSDGSSQNLSLRGEYRLIGGLTLAFGGNREWTEYRTDSDTGEDATITGAYLQAGWVLGGLAAHIGARLDDHDRFGSATSFGGDVSYALGEGWRLRASVGEGFKAPSLFQLYSDFGNLDLRPEKSTSMDLGLERGTRGSGFHAAVTAFRRDSEDLIGFDNATFTYANIAEARAQGLEVELGADIAPALRVAGVYSLLDAENRLSGNDLARRPRHSATLFADWQTPVGAVIGADLRLVGDSFDNAANSVRLEGYEVFDLRASFPLTGALEVFGRVENVFDEEYQTAAGYGSPGRGAFLGVRAQM